jgi:hypothetical protein
MESITKAIQSSGASEALTYLKGIGNKVKQMALNLSEIEVKVEDATNNDPWGPHGTVMAGAGGGTPITSVRSCWLSRCAWVCAVSACENFCARPCLRRCGVGRRRRAA